MNKKALSLLLATLSITGVPSLQAHNNPPDTVDMSSSKIAYFSPTHPFSQKIKIFEMLTKKERHQLRAAKKAAIAANPSLAKKNVSKKELREAMIKVDPSVKPIIEKIHKARGKTTSPTSQKTAPHAV